MRKPELTIEQPTIEQKIRSLQKRIKILAERYTLPCPHCGKSISASMVATVAAQRASAMRKTHGAGTGRPRKLVPCPKCSKDFGVAELRKHKPRCEG